MQVGSKGSRAVGVAKISFGDDIIAADVSLSKSKFVSAMFLGDGLAERKPGRVEMCEIMVS